VPGLLVVAGENANDDTRSAVLDERPHQSRERPHSISSLLPHLVPQHLVRDKRSNACIGIRRRSDRPSGGLRRRLIRRTWRSNLMTMIAGPTEKTKKEESTVRLQGGVLTLRGEALASGRSSDLGTRAGR
jgi:hypothetical protein